MASSPLQINVAGIPLDLYRDEEKNFHITKQVYDVSDLETRDASFSKSITIPLTPRNRKILGDKVPSVERFNTDATRSIPCEVLIKGVPVIDDSFLLVGAEQEKEQTLEVQVIGGTAKFFNQLQDEPINALDFTEHNLEWTLAGILPIVENNGAIVFADSQHYSNKSRRTFEAGSPNLLLSNLDEQELGESGFWMKATTVLDKIFSGLKDISVDQSLMDAMYGELAFYVPVPVIHNSFGAIEGSYTEVQKNAKQYFTVIGELCTFPIIVDNTSGYWDAPSNRFLFIEAGFFVINLDVAGGNDNEISQGSLFMEVYKVNTVTFESQSLGGVTINRETTSGSVNVSVNVVANDAIYFRTVSFAPSPTGFIETGTFTLTAQGAGRGRTVNVSQILPEISQRDFIKSIFQIQNIVPIENNDVVQLRYFENLKNTPSLTLPLNKKLSTQFAGTIGGYAQQNFLQYSENEAVERTDTSSNFPVNNQTLQKSTVKIQSKFSATDSAIVGANGNFPFLSVPNYELEYKFVSDNKVTVALGGTTFATQDRNDLEAGDFISIDNGGTINIRRITAIVDDFNGVVDVAWTEQQNAVDFATWRFNINEVQLHLARIVNNDTFGITINDGGISQTYNQHYQTQFTGLVWSSLQNVYYKLLIDAAFKPFVVRAWMDLSVVTYISIDGLEPMYIEEYDAYFYANKIEQWKYNGSTRVELIQIPI